MLVNLGGESVSGVSLALTQGPLAVGVRAELLLGAGEPLAPQVTAAGGFAEYQPLPELGPFESVLIRLGP